MIPVFYLSLILASISDSVFIAYKTIAIIESYENKAKLEKIVWTK